MKTIEVVVEQERNGLKVKTISVNYERKLNMGNYESATVGVTVWADLDDGEKIEAVTESFAELWALAKEQVKGKLTPLDEWRRKKNGGEDY
jgi:hypothetical protein